MKPKFDECEQCRFFSKRHMNPICRECDIGEFFEERRNVRTPTDEELMKMYGSMHDES